MLKSGEYGGCRLVVLRDSPQQWCGCSSSVHTHIVVQQCGFSRQLPRPTIFHIFMELHKCIAISYVRWKRDERFDFLESCRQSSADLWIWKQTLGLPTRSSSSIFVLPLLNKRRIHFLTCWILVTPSPCMQLSSVHEFQAILNFRTLKPGLWRAVLTFGRYTISKRSTHD